MKRAIDVARRAVYEIRMINLSRSCGAHFGADRLASSVMHKSCRVEIQGYRLFRSSEFRIGDTKASPDVRTRRPIPRWHVHTRRHRIKSHARDRFGTEL